MIYTVVNQAILGVFILFFCLDSVASAQCTKPAVRKEWRKLSVSEKTDWIRAVNVHKIYLYVTRS